MPQTSYKTYRPMMHTGGTIAFGGKKLTDRIIKKKTGSSVSHTSSLVRAAYPGGYLNLLIEARPSGVEVNRLSNRLATFEGEVWWLPLDPKLRRDKFDEGKFVDWLFWQVGKPYDYKEAIKSAIDRWDEGRGWSYNHEDFLRFFCSKLSAAACEISGLSGPVNASEVTPIDYCRWRIYGSNYFLLQGDPAIKIEGFNTLPPSDWDY